MSADKQLTSAEIDELCDRFEQQCKAAHQGGGSPPHIEGYLSELSGDDREQVLRELLFIDHDYRRRAGGSVDEATYHERFPDHTYIVDEVLSQGLGHDCDTQLHSRYARTAVRGESDAGDGTFGTLLEALPADDDADGVGPSLGDYEVLGELGRGGMGIVFRARQKSVDRLVALKVLRRDKLSELPEDAQATMIERFRTESQSAAQLEHDHIVPVYEVGEADGVHYYSMRLVQGESLAEVIAEHPLDNHSAAEAIEPIARALQAAHDRGVLHRDIKPRNIMVDDTTGRPLLTDFGLAKLIENATDMTHTGDVMGSPPYMSPEQATDAAHVTAAADIYSLGATFYHALTGRPPFQAATMAETLRQVWFDDAPPPRSLNPAIDQDLETICLKCLEKEPTRRFASAGELANELQRYLRGEAILSRPIGTLGQLQRWRRRNPTVAKLAAAVVVLVIVGFVGFAYYTTQLRKSLGETQESLGWAVGAVNEMTDIATKEDGLKAHGVDDVRREMLNASRQYYDRFVERESDDPVLETERGKAYGRLANIEADLGNQDEAIRLYKQSFEVFVALAKNYPDDQSYTYLRAAYLTNLAGLYRDFGRLDDAEATLDEAYALASELHDGVTTSIDYAALLGQIHNERGVVYMDIGKVDAAERARLESVNLWKQIVDADNQHEHRHHLATSHNNLAEFYRGVGDRDKAIEHCTAAKDLWEKLAHDHEMISGYTAGLAMCEYSLGLMHLDAGELDQAQPLLMAALGRRYRLADKHSQLPQYRDDLAASLDGMGRLFHEQGDYDRAANEYRQALSIREELRNKFADVPKYEVAYAASLMNLGYLYKDDRLFAQAADSFRIALDVLGRVVDENPDVVAHSEHLAGAYFNLAQVLVLDGELSEAETQCAAAIEIQDRLTSASGGGISRMALPESYQLLASIQDNQGKHAAAAQTLEKLIELRETTFTGSNRSPADLQRIAESYFEVAGHRATLGELEAALSALSSTIETLQKAIAATEPPESATKLLPVAHSARADVYDELGRHNLAVKDCDVVLRYDPHPLNHLARAISLARSGEHSAASAVASTLPALNSDTHYTLLLSAAAVLSRCAEAAQHDEHLDDISRMRLVDGYLKQATAYLKRCLDNWPDDRDALLDGFRQDPDLAPWRKSPAAAELLGEPPVASDDAD